MTEETGGDGICTRRGLLAAIGAASVASTAGCLTTLPSFGQRIRYGEVDEPSVDPPVYRDWLPESSRSATYIEPGAWGADTLGPPDVIDTIKERMAYVGMAFDSFDYAIAVDGTIVGRGTIDRAVAEETLTRVGYQSEGTERGYEFYYHPDSERAVAVGESAVLTAEETLDVSDPRAAILETLDAKAGRIARKHETSWKFARLTEEVGGQPAVTAADSGAIEFGGVEAVAQARGYTYDGDDAYVTMGAMSPEDETYSKSDIREVLSEFPEALEASRVDLRVDGRLANVVAKLPASVYRELVATYERPLSTWSVEYDAGRETVTFNYDAGERIDPAVLVAKYLDPTGAGDGGSSYEERSEPTPTQFGDKYGTVTPGASLTVDVSAFDEWRVFVEGQAPDDDYTWQEVSYNSTLIDE
jgi:hypothetical protein